ncbi:MAG: hypothetical protein KKC21_00105 [Nitrospinae bacterium]|nr:hypothetical protein [Nitrospinota bacterium]
MITLNLLKKYHGLRAKYYSDRKIMGKNHSFPFFYIILAAALIVGPYLGYSYISENVIPFFGNLISQKNPPAETPPTYVIAEPNLPALEIKETPKEGDTPDLEDAQPQRPPESVEPPKPNLPAVETETPKQIEKAEEIIKPAKGKTAPLPEERKPAELKKKDITIKIATFTVKSNAVSLKDKLDNLGYETAIREIPTILDTYKISYKNINADQFKKIQKALADQNIAYTAVKKKNSLDIESEESFVKSRFTDILSVGKSLNLKGIIEKGKKKTTIGHQVVIYSEDNKKIIDKKITYLKSVGFKPIVEKTMSN